MTKLVYNQDKTKELIEGLKAKGHIVTENDLSKLIRQSGVIVKESIGRKRSYIEVSPKLYGVNLSTKTQGTQDFFKSHVKKGKLSFINDLFEKELTNIEGKVRIARRRACIGFDEKFMTMEEYGEFQKKFEKWNEEYFNLRDRIIEPTHWSKMIKQFEESLRTSLRDLNALDQEILMDGIMKRIPTREEYAASFYMTLKLEAFPMADNLAMFTPEIQASMQANVNEDAIKAMYQMLGSQLNDMFAQTAKIIESVKKEGKVNSRLIKTMGTVAKRIRKNNILDNDVLTKLADDSDSLSKLSDVDDVSEAAHDLFYQVFGYAKDLNIVDTLDWLASPYTEKEVTDKATKKEAVNSMYHQLSMTINSAFTKSMSIIKDVIDGLEIGEEKLTKMSELADSLRQSNLTADGKMDTIADLSSAVGKLKVGDVDTIAEKAEELISFIYHYAKELKIEKDIDLSNSPYTKEELDDLVAILY